MAVYEEADAEEAAMGWPPPEPAAHKEEREKAAATSLGEQEAAEHKAKAETQSPTSTPVEAPGDDPSPPDTTGKRAREETSNSEDTVAKSAKTDDAPPASSGGESGEETTVSSSSPEHAKEGGKDAAGEAAAPAATEAKPTGSPPPGVVTREVTPPLGGPECEVIIQCPREMVGRCIGKNGETIKRLQSQSGANIQVDQKSMAAHELRLVQISGTEWQVATATTLVKEIIERGPTGPGTGAASAASSEADSAARGGGSGSVIKTIACDKKLLGRLIGRQGATISYLQTHSGCRIQIDRDAVPQPMVTVSAEFEAVAAAGLAM